MVMGAAAPMLGTHMVPHDGVWYGACKKLVLPLHCCERERWDSPAHVKCQGQKFVLLWMSPALCKIFILPSL